jgi:23S rRNA (adenine2030-N6)-methyltransferase
MHYRHSFHAGNFADVHKHITLLALIRAMQKKVKGFAFLDTHAGEGLYDLTSADARQSAESDHGIAMLAQAVADSPGNTHAAITAYLESLEQLRRHHGNKRSLYPGSPQWALMALRARDHATFVESHAQTSRALQRALDQSPSLVTPRVILGDGYQQIKAQLPPALRRGLVLIDPPYEVADEEQQIAAALTEALMRFETGVYALWYPIKRQYDVDLWLARILRGIERPALAIELCVRTPDHAAGLNGSGMLIINPPWQFDSDAAEWQPELHTLLGGTSGSAVKWLVNE